MDTAKEEFRLSLQKKAKRLLKDLKPSDPPTDFDKYLKVDFEIPYKFKMVDALGLCDSSFKKILDISTCAGWMTFILQHLGYETKYTDYLDFEVPLIKEIRKRLKLNECINFSYKSIGDTLPMEFEFVKLPEDIGIFDVIMANSVQPHGYFQPWMWRQFIKDCFDHLNEDGYIYISPNHSQGWNALEYISDDFNSEKILEGWRIRK